MFLLPTLGSLHVLKCGDLDAAQSVFNGVAMRTVVSWNSMIAACACLEGFIEIIDCFLHMCHEEVRPDVGHHSQLIVLMCSPQSAFTRNLLHSRGIRAGFDSNASVMNTLIAMYSKCGDLVSA